MLKLDFLVIDISQSVSQERSVLLVLVLTSFLLDWLRHCLGSGLSDAEDLAVKFKEHNAPCL